MIGITLLDFLNHISLSSISDFLTSLETWDLIIDDSVIDNIIENHTIALYGKNRMNNGVIINDDSKIDVIAYDEPIPHPNIKKNAAIENKININTV